MTAVRDASAIPADGRHARRERNRLAVVDAMLALYNDGNYQPSSDEIAARAGLSARSLFRYFDDIDDLVRVVISRQFERVRALAIIDLATDSPTAARVDRLVASRLGTYATIATVGKVSRARALTQPLIAAQLAQARAMWRAQIAALFAPELANAADGASVLHALDALTSFEAVAYLREQGARDAEIEHALTVGITRLLAHPDVTDETRLEHR